MLPIMENFQTAVDAAVQSLAVGMKRDARLFADALNRWLNDLFAELPRPNWRDELNQLLSTCDRRWGTILEEHSKRDLFNWVAGEIEWAEHLEPRLPKTAASTYPAWRSDAINSEVHVGAATIDHLAATGATEASKPARSLPSVSESTKTHQPQHQVTAVNDSHDNPDPGVGSDANDGVVQNKHDVSVPQSAIAAITMLESDASDVDAPDESPSAGWPAGRFFRRYLPDIVQRGGQIIPPLPTIPNSPKADAGGIALGGVTGRAQAKPFQYVPGAVVFVNLVKPAANDSLAKEENRAGSHMAFRWTVNAPAFRDFAGAQLADELGVVQIKKVTVRYAGGSFVATVFDEWYNSSDWSLDYGIPYPYIPGRNTIKNPAVNHSSDPTMFVSPVAFFSDDPNALMNRWHYSTLIYLKQDYELHVVALSGKEKGATYGGVSWGHEFRIKSVAHYWRNRAAIPNKAGLSAYNYSSYTTQLSGPLSAEWQKAWQSNQ
jgi:hypothetical protein